MDSISNVTKNIANFLDTQRTVVYVEHIDGNGNRYLCYLKGRGTVFDGDVDYMPELVSTDVYAGEDGKLRRVDTLEEFLKNAGYDPEVDYEFVKRPGGEKVGLTLVDDNIAAFLETRNEVAYVGYQLIRFVGGSDVSLYANVHGWDQTGGIYRPTKDEFVQADPVVYMKSKSRYGGSWGGTLDEYLAANGYDPDKDYGELKPLAKGSGKRYDLDDEYLRAWACGVVNEVGCGLEEAMDFANWLSNMKRDDGMNLHRYRLQWEPSDQWDSRIRLKDLELGCTYSSVEYMFRKWKRDWWRRNEYDQR